MLPLGYLVNKGEVSRWPMVISTHPSDRSLCASGRCRPPPPQVRPKDRLYYKKLLDRYFGTNHALAQDTDSLSSNSAGGNMHSRGSDLSGINRTWNAAASVGSGGGGGGGGGGGDEGGGKLVRVSMQQFPQVRLAYSSYNNNNNTAAQQLTRNAHSGGELEVSGLWLQHLALAWLAG